MLNIGFMQTHFLEGLSLLFKFNGWVLGATCNTAFLNLPTPAKAVDVTKHVCMRHGLNSFGGISSITELKLLPYFVKLL